MEWGLEDNSTAKQLNIMTFLIRCRVPVFENATQRLPYNPVARC